MREILISTESGSDLPDALVRKYQVYVAPMHIIMDGESLDDGCFPIDRVFDYFDETGRIPTTSAVNEGEYIDFFHKLQDEHPGCVIYHFAYSSAASSTYSHAKLAIEDEGFRDIYLIDTKSVSGGCTAYIAEAYKLIQERKATVMDYAALAEELQALSDRIECQFIPATLTYLRAGGRVSNASYLVANILNLKPLIEINSDGRLIATKKYRGSMRRIVDKFYKDFLRRYDCQKDTLYLMYGKGLAQDVLDRMREIALENGFKDTQYVMTGGTISCHGGKGAMGIAAVTRISIV
ncbi:MAG: DegV family protein [Eubacteriales bacterium]|jgi:DegV family protein with EDD domain|nr:DegV family EDD domain-containing protein [Lachnospiraceae bacterium]MDD5860875.1 DegV family protein [Eubacteriales bacterium]